jgi:DNA repair protein RecN (Recombination protein N)
MLDELVVRNLGLIPSARMDPGGGLVVITGETGTGKTLLLGALRLLRGEQARKDQIGPHGDETVAEGRFVDGGEEHVIVRRVDRNRSRATLDGELTTAASLTATLEGVLDVVGQDDRTHLSRATAARTLVDAALDAEGRSALAAYGIAWEMLEALQAEFDALGGDRRALERELDMVRFQSREIATAGFRPGDDADLASRAERLRNAEELRERLTAARMAAGEDGASGAFEVSGRELAAATRVDGALAPLVELNDQLAELLGELLGELTRALSDLDHDPGELDAVESQLARLGDLKRKYGDTLEAVLAFAASAEARVGELEGLLGRADVIGADLTRARSEAGDAARRLTEARRAAAGDIADRAVGHLRDVGFDDPVVRFSFLPAELGPAGADRVVLEFASDRALEPAPMSRIASGGELSRVILALRLAAGAGQVEIIAFDEIDAGVGGATALSMGRKLRALADERQVFCVTHLPQVAAFADRQFVVTRRGNEATVERVDGPRRVEELARMLAGLSDSERGREHAAELLALAAGG